MELTLWSNGINGSKWWGEWQMRTIDSVARSSSEHVDGYLFEGREPGVVLLAHAARQLRAGRHPLLRPAPVQPQLVQLLRQLLQQLTQHAATRLVTQRGAGEALHALERTVRFLRHVRVRATNVFFDSSWYSSNERLFLKAWVISTVLMVVLWKCSW